MTQSGIRIKELYIYPLKSARGIALRHASVEGRGLRFDRRWMVVDATGTFISQRTHPLLSHVDVSVDGMHLTLSAHRHGEVRLPLYPASAIRRPVTVWDDVVSAMGADREADEWVSGLLGEPCSIVYFPDDARRPVDATYARHHEQTAFSDGFPVLVVGQASLDALNERLAEPVSMDRFRPNIVVEGSEPFAEDAWGTIMAGGTVLEIVKPCARCVITTIDQRTGHKGTEPLATLAGFRKTGGNILFGQNALVRTPGTIGAGDRISFPPSRSETAA